MKCQILFSRINEKNITNLSSAETCLCWGLTTHQPLWVILCHLSEKGRREMEEIVEEEMKERDLEER